MVRVPVERQSKDQIGRSSGMSGDNAKDTALDELTTRFDAELASLNDPKAAQKVQRVLEAKGKLRHPPKAGETF